MMNPKVDQYLQGKGIMPRKNMPIGIVSNDDALLKAYKKAYGKNYLSMYPKI